MDSKHTPGPWKVEDYKYSRRGQKFSTIGIAAKGFWIVTEVSGSGFEGSTEANARLIALAPEQHEFIVFVRDACSRIQLGEDVGEELEDIESQALTLLARAGCDC